MITRSDSKIHNFHVLRSKKPKATYKVDTFSTIMLYFSILYGPACAVDIMNYPKKYLLFYLDKEKKNI